MIRNHMSKSKKNTDEVLELYQNLLKLHEKLRKDKKTKWDRVLPFEELLFDRCEKAKFLKAGEKSSVYHSSHILGKVKIGKNTWIGPFTLLDGSGGEIKIGSYCSISSGVQIYSHDTVKWSLTGGKAEFEKGNVSIGDNCYIGPNVIISKGVKIGKGCIIGANSFVNRNIPQNSIVFGVPAKKVGKVKISGKKISLEYL
jgi:acetyltransferase-like isoleucine patch superfamily enzyme